MAEQMARTNAPWMPEPILWTREQTARYLNVSVRTVGNLLRKGELVKYHIGSRCLIHRSSVENFLKKRNHPT
jgi:excisionase family DNA binding protein